MSSKQPIPARACNGIDSDHAFGDDEHKTSTGQSYDSFLFVCVFLEV